MKEEIEYYCDKCNSTHVELRVVKPEVKKVKKPMSEMPHPDEATTTPAVYIINEWEAHCRDCGHTVRIPRPPMFMHMNLASDHDFVPLNEQQMNIKYTGDKPDSMNLGGSNSG